MDAERLMQALTARNDAKQRVRDLEIEVAEKQQELESAREDFRVARESFERVSGGTE